MPDTDIRNTGISAARVIEVLQERAKKDQTLALHIEAATLQVVTSMQADQIRMMTIEATQESERDVKSDAPARKPRSKK